MTAAAAARAEAHAWARLASDWAGLRDRPVWADRAATEAAVVVFHDPASDLARRAAAWGYQPDGGDLADLARFAAGLAGAEADAWERDDPVVATRAYEARRFLVGDRIVAWAVPWLDIAGRCYPEERDRAHAARATLLDLADRLRPAPDLAGGEGAHAPGEDGYGPISPEVPLASWLRSLWSGAVLLDRTLVSMRGTADLAALLADDGFRGDLATVYEITAARWRRLAAEHPGSAALWRDLGERADRTARDLAYSSP